MNYPLRKTFTIYLTIHLFWREKTIRLEIPQATIRDISEFSNLTDIQRSTWTILKLKEWGAWLYSTRLAWFLGSNIEGILADTFFHKREQKRLPESVVNLSSKEWIYDYDSPDSVLFATIATEYGIDPHNLLDYTMDELSYLLLALQYKYLNEEQKKELARIKIEQEFIDNKEIIDQDINTLDDYFNNNK